MAFEGLTEKLQGALRKLSSKGKLTEENVKEGMREVRMALLEADVNYKVAKDFCAQVSERAMGQEVMESLTPAQQVVKIVNEELTKLMGGEEPTMGLEDKKETKAAVSFENHENKIYREPRPFAATAEELEAHKAFLESKIKNAVWLS